jgi:hypothetical protein
MELKPFNIDVIVIEPGAIRIEWDQIVLDTLQQALSLRDTPGV